ncbi:MAG TPA: 3-oxoacyl-[acyl-carrier-protein] reductase [Thermoanaerobaculia bacterium]|nr:3-oxoacyl-[acyl-carrier-protein] reductase [Thermoanaerobaculia bacterium]
MFDLKNRTALVTGASRGIGEAIARTLAGRGARVVLAARNLEALEGVAAAIRAAGGEAATLQLDLADAERIAEAFATLEPPFAEVDILVNNAGITQDTILLRMSLDQWRRVLDTNLTGAFALTKAAVKGMMRRRWGRVISISSVVGLMGNPGQCNYAAAKAGLVGFSKSLARELGSRGITVNVVAPGYIETAMTADLAAEARERLLAGITLERLGRSEEVAAAVCYLASEEAGYVTGEVLNVSGGLYM